MRKPSFRPTTRQLPRACPGCGSNEPVPFFELTGVPTNSCILLESRDEARSHPTGDILLGFCPCCGFIANYAFTASLTEYSARYEGTQGFSPTFSSYNRELVAGLIERHGLRERKIIEIGCGKGEFLTLLCEMGANSGIGFDPAFREDRNPRAVGTDVRFVPELFSEKYSDLSADFYCSKMTLEHIPEVGAFMQMLRRSIGCRPESLVYLQVPEAARILRKGMFCDVPYEHCSYFSPESLRILFQRSGFRVRETILSYGGQHLAIEAEPAPPSEPDVDLSALQELVESFAQRCAEEIGKWVSLLGPAFRSRKRVVLWGSGSKSTAFLTSMGIDSGIETVVDVNPYRQGMFMAGTGQKIVAPEFLREVRPDLVIIMNPIYRAEIAESIASLGLKPEIMTLV